MPLSSDRSRSYRTQAVILRRRDHNDADRIVKVFTPRLGKLDLIGKGVRKTQSRKAGHLELFAHVTLQVAQARAWDIITEVTTTESFRFLRQNLDGISRTGYVCELVDAFTEMHDENLPLWDLLLLVLRELNQLEERLLSEPTAAPDLDVGVLLRWFELNLLTLGGYQPEFFHCLHCAEELQATTNLLSINGGGVYCGRCGPGRGETEAITADVLKVLRFLQSRSWFEVRSLRVRPPIMQEVEGVVYRFLLAALERQLKSVPFLRQVHANSLRRQPLPDAAPPEG